MILAASFYFFLDRLLKFLTGQHAGAPSASMPPARRPEGDEMVQDPQCKVYVPISRAVKKTFGGNTLHFCSEDCARQFLKRIGR